MSPVWLATIGIDEVSRPRIAGYFQGKHLGVGWTLTTGSGLAQPVVHSNIDVLAQIFAEMYCRLPGVPPNPSV
jgi:hypothetical protein